MALRKSVVVEHRNGFVWVVLPDSMSRDNYMAVEREVEAELSGKKDRVVLDLIATNSVYSSGIGFMVRLRKKIIESGGVLCLVNVSREIRELFGRANLDRVFEIYATDVEFDISRDDVWGADKAAEASRFLFVFQVEDQVCRITMSGAMDSLHDLSRMSEFRAGEDVKCFVLNLESLDLVDSYAGRFFFEFLQRVGKDVSGKCAIYGANEIVVQLLGLFAVDRLAKFFDTEDEALAHVQA